MESLMQVDAGLQDPQDVVIPSGESQSAEANNPPRSAASERSAAEEKKERKRAKKQRQQAERSPEEQYEIYKSKTMREYSFYLRIAFATIMKCPIDYYSAPDEMWTLPEPGNPYSVDDVIKMLCKGTGLEFPYPDAAVPGREEIPPAAPESVKQRQNRRSHPGGSDDGILDAS